MCFPRIEVGQPTICSETCVGRLRYLGLVLYDADKVQAAASVPERAGPATRRNWACSSIRTTPRCAGRRRDGIPDDWIEAARRSPVYALAVKHRVALPLHPEYRTLPMVWYVPPLSPVVGHGGRGGTTEADPDDVFATIDELRIPIAYLANLFSAGDEAPVRLALKRLAAMRAIMRERNLGAEADAAVAEAVGLDLAKLEHLYRLLAIAHYNERYVIPKGHAEVAGPLVDAQGGGGFPQPLRQPPQQTGGTGFVPLSKLGRFGA